MEKNEVDTKREGQKKEMEKNEDTKKKRRYRIRKGIQTKREKGDRENMR